MHGTYIVRLQVRGPGLLADSVWLEVVVGETGFLYLLTIWSIFPVLRGMGVHLRW